MVDDNSCMVGFAAVDVLDCCPNKVKQVDNNNTKRTSFVLIRTIEFNKLYVSHIAAVNVVIFRIITKNCKMNLDGTSMTISVIYPWYICI